MSVVRRSSTRLLLLVLALATIVSLAVAPDRIAHAAPPPNPSDGQLHGAAAHKAAVAAEVGRLGASVASMQSRLRQLEAAQEMAEQKLAFALSKLADAKQASANAARAVTAATARVDAAQEQFASFAQATYMNGSISGMTGSLLTAQDPNGLLQQSALQQYEADHQLDAISAVKSATVAKSNADAAARLAVARQKSAAETAKQAKEDADSAVVAAIAQKQQLESRLAAQQVALQNAQEELATLNHQRAAYIKWKKHQEALRRARERARRLAEARARAAAARAAAAERRREAAERRREAAERRREAAANRHHHQSGGSHQSSGGHHHSSGGHRSSGGGGAIHRRGGGWSHRAGWDAVHRAERWLGWMYAWAGGNAYGPTYGVCAGDGAYNDCHVRGFDCSGLSLYAWAPYKRMDHYAASQYWEAGSYHPSTSQLLPGDLTFWSSNGSPSGIHHVAIYIGGGNVIQAPQSGSVIQITPLWSVDWGYLGATRPLT
ncbi:MAG TPA: NlpC/P60 family protein [Jatrophihabitans sp.]